MICSAYSAAKAQSAEKGAISFAIAPTSQRYGEAILPTFIDRGAPLRRTLLPPKAADFPMQNVKW